MAFTPFSAKNAKVRLNGNTFTAKSWTVEATADEIDVSNFEGNGFSDAIGGLKNATITVEYDFDGQSNPFDAPITLAPGQTGTNVRLYLNGTTGPYWSFPSVLVTATPNSANVKEALKGTIRMRNKGTYTAPTGAAA